MLDEHGNPALLYPLHMNDHFDMLGILQSREFVAQIPPTMSMEILVDWAATLKDTAASLDGTVIQVLFDNMDTGRVSQLQSLPAKLQTIPFTEQSNKSDFFRNAIRMRTAGESRHREGTSSSSNSISISSDDSYGRLTPYQSDSKRRRSESPSSDRHPEGEGLETVKQRGLRPNSPGRYYRPKSSSNYYRPAKRGKHSRSSEKKNRSPSKDKKDESLQGSSDLITTNIKATETKVEVIAPETKVEKVKV